MLHAGSCVSITAFPNPGRLRCRGHVGAREIGGGKWARVREGSKGGEEGRVERAGAREEPPGGRGGFSGTSLCRRPSHRGQRHPKRRREADSCCIRTVCTLSGPSPSRLSPALSLPTQSHMHAHIEIHVQHFNVYTHRHTSTHARTHSKSICMLIQEPLWWGQVPK